MSDNIEKSFDNSEEAVWQREVNELDEKIKRSEYYSASELEYMKSRKKQLEEAIAKKKQPKKDLTGGFAKGQQNIQNMSDAQQQALLAQMYGNRNAA